MFMPKRCSWLSCIPDVKDKLYFTFLFPGRPVTKDTLDIKHTRKRRLVFLQPRKPWRLPVWVSAWTTGLSAGDRTASQTQGFQTCCDTVRSA